MSWLKKHEWWFTPLVMVLAVIVASDLPKEPARMVGLVIIVFAIWRIYANRDRLRNTRIG